MNDLGVDGIVENGENEYSQEQGVESRKEGDPNGDWCRPTIYNLYLKVTESFIYRD